MKSKLIALAMLFVSVATAQVMMISNTKQSAPSETIITTLDVAPFLGVALSSINLPDQEVYLTVTQNGTASDIDLFANSWGNSNHMTGMQMVLGPFLVQSGQTNIVIIYGRVNSVKPTNSMPMVRLDLTTVSNSITSSMQGTLPILGNPYLVNTNSFDTLHGKFTSIGLTYNYDDYYQVHYYELNIVIKAEPLRLYDLERSTNMINWEVWVKGMMSGSGNIQVAAFLNTTNFPTNENYRLKSQ